MMRLKRNISYFPQSIISVFFILIFFVSFSQNIPEYSRYKWRFGIGGSYQATILNNKDDKSFSDETNSELSFGNNIGVFVAKSLGDYTSISLGLGINTINQSMNGSFEYGFCDDVPPFNCYTYSATYDSEIKLDYVQIPIYVSHYIRSLDKKIRFLAFYGVDLSFLKSGSLEINFKNYAMANYRLYSGDEIKEVFTNHGFYFSLGFGSEIRLNQHFKLCFIPYMNFSMFDIENKKYDNSSWRFPIGTNVHDLYSNPEKYDNRPITRNLNFGLNIKIAFDFNQIIKFSTTE